MSKLIVIKLERKNFSTANITFIYHSLHIYVIKSNTAQFKCTFFFLLFLWHQLNHQKIISFIFYCFVVGVIYIRDSNHNPKFRKIFKIRSPKKLQLRMVKYWLKLLNYRNRVEHFH